MSLPILLAAAAIAVTPLAAAADWFRVGASDKVTWYIDAGSIKKNGKWLSVSEYADYTSVSTSTGVKSVKLRTDYDCAARAYRNTYILALGENGDVKLDLEQGENAEVQTNVQQGTIVGSALAFVCGEDRSRAVRVSDPTPR